MASQHIPEGDLSQSTRRRLTPLSTFTALGACSALILAGSMLTGKVSGKEAQRVDSSDARPLVIPSPVSLSNGFSAIAKQVGPAVVNINTESTPKQAQNRRNRRAMPEGAMPGNPNGGGGGGGEDDDNSNNMQDFFNHFFGGQGGGQPDMSTRRALGSGFIVDPRGYIITNNHVIDKADHIYVKLSTDPDGTLDEGRPARVIGVDPSTDIAVIKIDAKDPLPTIKLGNSTSAQVGDWVLAIGSPFGLSKTVSAGIVSAINRAGSDLEQGGGPNGIDQSTFQHFIQTDAAINPGNSGGPLVDMAGEVIGMNTAIYTQSAGSEGVGFALPSNLLINVYNQLISPSHTVTRGSIGIQFQAAQSSAVSRMYGFASGGVLISVVTPNGPAAKAGLRPQDVIVSIDGQPVKDGDGLIAVISSKTPGSRVHLGFLRDGKKDTAEVTIADRAELFKDRASNEDSAPSPQADAGQVKLGITEQPTKADVISKLGIHGGVTVMSVRPGSFAEQIQLQPGDIIVEINRKPINNEADYRSFVSALKPGDDIVFVVRNVHDASGGDSYRGGTLQ